MNVEGIIIRCTMISMNVFDFVKGLLIGIFMALINALNHASKGSISMDEIMDEHATSSYSCIMDIITSFKNPEQEMYLQRKLRHALKIIVISGYSFFGNATRTLRCNGVHFKSHSMCPCLVQGCPHLW